MGMMDFLFDGKPPASVTTYGTSTENMPKWLSDYTQGLIGRANSIASEPYQAYEGPRVAGFTPDQQNAFSMTRGMAGAYQPALAGAQATAGGALSAAQPYINQASQTFPQALQSYMNPYAENVVNRASTLAGRTLNEKFLPSVQAMFGAAGSGPRSTQMRRTVDQGVRDITEGLQEQAQGALAQGYNSAGTLFNADASRAAGLAGTVGNLSLNSSQQQGSLAELAQSMGLRDAAAQEAVGSQQQGLNQRSLDTSYQDFLQQRGYPRETIDWMSSVIRGLPTPTQTQVSSTGPSSVYQPSPLANIASLATGIGGILGSFKARGGRVRRPVRYYRGGALRSYHGR